MFVYPYILGTLSSHSVLPSSSASKWFPDVPLSTKSKSINKVIQGRPDWCLSYGETKSELEISMIVPCASYPDA